jgi:hypothetical protein
MKCWNFFWYENEFLQRNPKRCKIDVRSGVQGVSAIDFSNEQLFTTLLS